MTKQGNSIDQNHKHKVLAMIKVGKIASVAWNWFCVNQSKRLVNSFTFMSIISNITTY